MNTFDKIKNEIIDFSKTLSDFEKIFIVRNIYSRYAIYIIANTDIKNEPNFNEELKEQIDIFMTSLSKSHRQIFILRYWYFMPVKEIAKCTNMSISKVESILFRTRKKLKKQLTERKYL